MTTTSATIADVAESRATPLPVAAPSTSDRAPHRTPLGRIASLDAMRGLIIVIMAIDHARAFIAKNHPGEFWGRPLPDYGPDTLAFLTRLVTHLCAPGFLFLMGAGMTFFAASRASAGWSPGRITRAFVGRGLTLIVLGQLLENGAVIVGVVLSQAPVVDYGVVPPGADGTLPFIILPVLYGLGSAMAVSGLIHRLRPAALWLVAGLIVAAVAWLTPDASRAGERFHPVLRLLFVPGQSGHLLAIYSTLPLLPAVLLGLAFGRWILDDRRRAFTRIALVGAVFLVAFVAVRSAGGFGNLDVPRPGWIGFLNVTKYPPSLPFLLMTLGVDFLLLAAIERGRFAARGWARPLLVFGSTPFFFFVTHMWLYAAMGLLIQTALPISQMYFFWLLGLVLLYLPCRWYGDFKHRQPLVSIWRLF